MEAETVERLAAVSKAAAAEAEVARLAAEDAAIAWYGEGASQADLARALGVSPPAVLYMLRRRGVLGH